MKEQVVVGVLVALAFLVLSQKIDWKLKAIWSYFLFIASFHTFWPYYEPSYAPQISNILAWMETQAIFLMIVLPIAVLNLSDKNKDRLISFMKWYMVYDCVVLLTGGKGIFGATTFDATVISCFILFWDLRNKKELLGFILSISAALYTHSRTAGLVLGVSFITLAIQKLYKYETKRKATSYAIKVISVLIVAVILYGPHLMKDPRFNMWESFFYWWKLKADLIFGTGIGTFEWIGPNLDPGDTYRNSGLVFYLMHNDWLQILFESGFVGFTLAVFGYCYVAVKLKGRDFAIWISIGSAMIFYYVSHTWVIQMLSLILISRLPSSTSMDNIIRKTSSSTGVNKDTICSYD